MHYLKGDDPFVSVTRAPFVIEDPEEGMPAHEATVAEMIALTLKRYVPRQGHTLEQMGEIRALNRCIDRLEHRELYELPEDGYYAFEDEDWKVLRRVMGWMLPIVPWFRNAPAIDELLDQAATHHPQVATNAGAEA